MKQELSNLNHGKALLLSAQKFQKERMYIYMEILALWSEQVLILSLTDVISPTLS